MPGKIIISYKIRKMVTETGKVIKRQNDGATDR